MLIALALLDNKIEKLFPMSVITASTAVKSASPAASTLPVKTDSTKSLLAKLTTPSLSFTIALAIDCIMAFVASTVVRLSLPPAALTRALVEATSIFITFAASDCILTAIAFSAALFVGSNAAASGS